MDRAKQVILGALVLASLAALPSGANEQIAGKERTKCTVCHTRKGTNLLTNKGKYYEYKRTFAGYDQILRKFKKCTLCHVQAPGTPELTTTGRELKNREVTMDHLSAPDQPRAPG